jgi:hypothetical protein
MTARRASPRKSTAQRGPVGILSRFRRSRWAVGIAVAVIAAGAIAWGVLRRSPETVGSSRLPGPLGGPDIAQDVTSLVGKPAPPFALSDSEGKSYTVTPGAGRPLVLIFHMGIT